MRWQRISTATSKKENNECVYREGGAKNQIYFLLISYSSFPNTHARAHTQKNLSFTGRGLRLPISNVILLYSLQAN